VAEAARLMLVQSEEAGYGSPCELEIEGRGAEKAARSEHRLHWTFGQRL